MSEDARINPVCPYCGHHTLFRPEGWVVGGPVACANPRCDSNVVPSAGGGARCWCGGEVGSREPGDSGGFGCLEDIRHDWRGGGLMEFSDPADPREHLPDVPESPAAPQNVRLVDPLGNEWPCEVSYDGVEDGLHRWTAVPMVSPSVFPGSRWKIRVGMLPGRTAVAFALDIDKGDEVSTGEDGSP